MTTKNKPSQVEVSPLHAAYLAKRRKEDGQPAYRRVQDMIEKDMAKFNKEK